MKESRITGSGLGAIGLVLAAAIAGTYFVFLADPQDREARNAPQDRNVGATEVEVTPGRLILPSEAGERAAVEFSITNPTASRRYIIEARLINGNRTTLVDLKRVVNTRLANLWIEPGETLTIGPSNREVILTGYDSSVVPGAQVRLDLTFSDSTTVAVPLTVESVLGQGGQKKPGAEEW